MALFRTEVRVRPIMCPVCQQRGRQPRISHHPSGTEGAIRLQSLGQFQTAVPTQGQIERVALQRGGALCYPGMAQDPS